MMERVDKFIMLINGVDVSDAIVDFEVRERKTIEADRDRRRDEEIRRAKHADAKRRARNRRKRDRRRGR